MLLVAVPLTDGLLSLRWGAWCTWLTTAILLGLVTLWNGLSFALYVPSVVLPALLAWVFGRTLRADRVPLVVQIARSAREYVPDDLVVYSRRLTQMWTLMFVFMAVTAFALAASGQRQLWSLTTNFVNYALIGAVVLIEYGYRRWRFREYPHPGFLEYLQILVRANPRRMS
jgi:uncharacterized membrane protein